VPQRLFHQFLNSGDTLWVYHGGKLVFNSNKEQLSPLLDYIHSFRPKVRGVTVFDVVVGNAAALLLKKASCLEVYSPLGSEFAAQTLRHQGIKFHFSKTVPHILNERGNDICPMEKLSLGKRPEEFYRILKKH
jgi:Domain of unknown function (DUF1893)